VPVLAVVLALGLLVALGALLYRLNGLAFGEAQGSHAPVRASYVPMFTHLGLVLAAGIFLPAPLVAWFQHVAELLR
jgi:hydrogenase-4 component F